MVNVFFVQWEMIVKVRFIFPVLLFGVAVSVTAQMGKDWFLEMIELELYKITDGKGKCLDVANDRSGFIGMDVCSSASGQQWKITRTGAGFYTFKNEWSGDTMCLDIVNEGGALKSRQPKMRPCGAYTGQLWAAKRGQEGGPFRLYNGWHGYLRELTRKSNAIGLGTVEMQDVAE